MQVLHCIKRGVTESLDTDETALLFTHFDCSAVDPLGFVRSVICVSPVPTGCVPV